MKKLVLMASGTGTNAINLISHAKNLDNVKIVGIIVDNKKSKLLTETLSVPVYFIKKLKSETKEEYDQKLINKIMELNAEWILLCGFMRILSPHFIQAFYDEKLKKAKIINIHPSLLPKYKGAHGYLDSYQSGDEICGVTLHFVNEELDAGEIFLQMGFKRDLSDNFDSFVAKGKAVEWKLYPQFLEWLDQVDSSMEYSCKQ